MRAAFAAVSASLLGAVGCTVHTDDPPPRQAREVVYVESATPAPPAPATRYRTPPPSTEVWVHGHRADRVSGPPGNWRNSPRVRYHGSDAHYVGGRWYYRSSAHGWVVMRDEPTELARSRTAGYGHGYGANRVHGYLADRTNRPANVNAYPRVPYGDSSAYLINGRWYYKVNDQYWVVFREEPRELARRRVELRNQGYVR
jgi:hypothetical protein